MALILHAMLKKGGELLAGASPARGSCGPDGETKGSSPPESRFFGAAERKQGGPRKDLRSKPGGRPAGPCFWVPLLETEPRLGLWP